MRLEKPHRLRVVLLGSVFLGLTCIVGARLQYLQYSEHDHYAERAERQHFKRVVIQAERGDILDREGHPLAQSTGRITVYINPTFLQAPEFDGNQDALAAAIALETSEPADTVLRRMNGSTTTALAKRLRVERARRVMDVLDNFEIDSRGYWIHRESIRLYPRHLAASVIGFCQKDGDGDNTGLSGLELKYDEHLRGTKISGRSQRSGISETLQPWEPNDLPEARGNSLVLTLDANIQEAVEDILARQVEEFSADSGGVVVMDPNSGGILAMASYPTFDNNNFSTASPNTMRNRTLTDPLETGSVVKLYTAAMLLDLGLVSPDTMIDCEGGYAVVDGRRLHDSPGHYLNVVTFREALRWSSNIGIVKAAQTLENPEWYGYLRSFGFGEPTGIDLPGEGGGILYPVDRWTKFSRTSLPMGYEIALTPVQIAAGISALVNGGNYYTPYVVQEIRDPNGNTVYTHSPEPDHRVIRPTTSAIMRTLMEDIVVNGTGKKAQVPGYRIGGKTGTTRKSDIFDRREYIASFGGALPIHEPQAVVYIYIDNPQGAYYASTVAAPAFQKIARAVTLHLGIPPSEDPLDHNLDQDETVPEETEVHLDSVSLAQDFEQLLYVGRMPDFTGMTMAQARRVLPEGVGEVRFLGSGSVSDQYPPAGDPLNEAAEIVLHFSPNSIETPEKPGESDYYAGASQ